MKNSDKNAQASVASKADSKPSADNQASQITDKDWRERYNVRWAKGAFDSQVITPLESELSRLKEENERLREDYRILEFKYSGSVASSLSEEAKSLLREAEGKKY